MIITSRMLLLNRFSAGWKNAEDNFHAKLVKNKCFTQSEYLITKWYYSPLSEDRIFISVEHIYSNRGSFITTALK